MEAKIEELQELLAKAENELEIYKKERIWAEKVKLMDQIDGKLEKISAESSQMLDILSEIEIGGENPDEQRSWWRELCKAQNDAAAVRRGVIDYMFKTAA